MDEPFGFGPLNAVNYHDRGYGVGGIDVNPGAGGGVEFGDWYVGAERNRLTQTTLRVVTVGATVGDWMS